MRLVLTRYFQCLPASTTSVTTTKSTTTTTKSTTTTTSTSATATAAPTGFVKVSGQKFTLNGATYTVVGCASLFLYRQCIRYFANVNVQPTRTGLASWAIRRRP
jgi:hypothetical protein